MKNQYFGDINDFFKYGILRALSGAGVNLSVCWMLTPDDDRGYGGKTDYLKKPKRYKPLDSDLFDFLLYHVENNRRNVLYLEKSNILKNCIYHSSILKDRKLYRQQYFQSLYSKPKIPSLVFFDPDKGIEVSSVKYGAKNSSGYIYWEEICCTYNMGHSVLVFQYFRREQRNEFINKLGKEFVQKLDAPFVISFRTPNVVFFLAPAEEMASTLRKRSFAMEQKWQTEIDVKQH